MLSSITWACFLPLALLSVLSKDKHGSAALSGLVGYYVVTTLLSPGSVAQLQHIDVSEVPAAFGKINNQFIGILIGVISAELYNRFYQVELPKALSFFSGKRLVPIVVSFVMMFISSYCFTSGHIFSAV